MNILTFDIEDWYNCDFITPDLDWDKYEVRIYEGVDRILQELDKHQLKATFFCLGWIAEKHPDVIRKIHVQGHHIGCHSYQHELATRFSPEEFKNDTQKAKFLIEDLIGEPVDAYRAPGFSITEGNIWALEILSELGFLYDCSILPASHDYGGFQSFQHKQPVLLKLKNGLQIKEFPIYVHNFWNKSFVFSGGGFFRFFPYFIIQHWAKETNYLMTYFHTRDFDPGQPVIQSLPLLRKFKSYVGLSTSFSKFQKLLDNFEFMSIREADKFIDWGKSLNIEV